MVLILVGLLSVPAQVLDEFERELIRERILRKMVARLDTPIASGLSWSAEAPRGVSRASVRCCQCGISIGAEPVLITIPSER